MFLLDNRVFRSQSDLTTAGKRESAFAFAPQLDAKVGLIEIELAPRDPLGARAAALVDDDENWWVEHYPARAGWLRSSSRASGVRSCPRPLD